MDDKLYYYNIMLSSTLHYVNEYLKWYCSENVCTVGRDRAGKLSTCTIGVHTGRMVNLISESLLPNCEFVAKPKI